MIVEATFIGDNTEPVSYENGKEYGLILLDASEHPTGLIQVAMITGEEKRVYNGITDFFKYWKNVSSKEV